MREIKFRAKRIDNGRWVYGQYFMTPLTDENSGTTPDSGWFFLTGEPRHCIAQDSVAFVIDKNTIGQYTGLNDRNGKEIYETDIVSVNQFGGTPRYELVRFNTFAGFASIHPFQDDGYHWAAQNCEIVGNKYENTDLI